MRTQIVLNPHGSGYIDVIGQVLRKFHSITPEAKKLLGDSPNGVYTVNPLYFEVFNQRLQTIPMRKVNIYNSHTNASQTFDVPVRITGTLNIMTYIKTANQWESGIVYHNDAFICNGYVAECETVF